MENSVAGFDTGAGSVETWIPDGGFQLVRRKGKTPEGTILTTDWLVPAWANAELTAARPCAEQPCLHRILADCQQDGIVHFVNMYGLLTAAGKPARAGALPPEPVDIWRSEIRAMRNATALWDAIAAQDSVALSRVLPQHQAAKGKELLRLAREHLARRVTEKLARGRMELIAPGGGESSQFVLNHRPARLSDALWQRFAEEISGAFACARCPAPKCGRWFVRSGGRSDRRFCSHNCQMRAWRAGGRQALRDR